MEKRNPVKWGAIGGILAAAIVVLGDVMGEPPSTNALLQDPFKAAGAGFFWGIVIALGLNWWAKKGTTGKKIAGLKPVSDPQNPQHPEHHQWANREGKYADE